MHDDTKVYLLLQEWEGNGKGIIQNNMQVYTFTREQIAHLINMMLVSIHEGRND